MLAPNHAPLTVAEQFGTLAALHEDRIDLGIGRGSGDVRRGPSPGAARGAGPATDAEYRQDVAAVLSFLVEEVALGPLPEAVAAGLQYRGAALAAALGLPVAIAHHIRPDNTLAVVEGYRAAFTASRWLRKRPRVLLCVRTVCAPTQEEAVWRAGSDERGQGRAPEGLSQAPFPTPAQAAVHPFTEQERQGAGTPSVRSRRSGRPRWWWGAGAAGRGDRGAGVDAGHARA
ncbi:LLM class flavin-dependent oxidoreductase [Streptomyces sp. INR7]|uniref:LLM class flavin-dependent oxidoreductase n=1 Tax=Streptomyces sp. INR7 TaxID=2607753 RepID=UPI0035BBC592